MRILIDPGSWTCSNMGDVAMLQVAVRRLRDWAAPAQIHVLTDDAAALQRHCPDAEPASHQGRLLWLGAAPTSSGDSNVATRIRGALMRRSERILRQTWPALYTRRLSRRFGQIPATKVALDGFVGVLSGADLFVACGQGTLADVAAEHAAVLLDTVETCARAGIPTCLLGQGIGPLDRADLRARAREVLRTTSLITLREGRRGAEALARLGVPPARYRVTGDDALESAFEARASQPGTHLGVHLRLAPLAIASRETISAIAATLRDFAAQHGAGLMPLPISHHASGANDARLLAELLREPAAPPHRLDTPARVIAATGRCRVVVTAAYHAAVFALGQGVPVVCIGQSAYYLDKFSGLHDQFGEACRVIPILGPGDLGRLGKVLAELWDQASTWRDSLLAVTEQQIAAGLAAYGEAVACARSAEEPCVSVQGAQAGLPGPAPTGRAVP